MTIDTKKAREMRAKGTDWKSRAEKAHESAKRFIDSHFGNIGEKPRIRIPADPERDDDLVLSDYITDSADEIDRLRALLDNARVCFIADTSMTEQQVKIRDRVEYAVGATTRDPDTGERRD